MQGKTFEEGNCNHSFPPSPSPFTPQYPPFPFAVPPPTHKPRPGPLYANLCPQWLVDVRLMVCRQSRVWRDPAQGVWHAVSSQQQQHYEQSAPGSNHSTSQSCSGQGGAVPTALSNFQWLRLASQQQQQRLRQTQLVPQLSRLNGQWGLA